MKKQKIKTKSIKLESIYLNGKLCGSGKFKMYYSHPDYGLSPRHWWVEFDSCPYFPHGVAKFLGATKSGEMLSGDLVFDSQPFRMEGVGACVYI